MRPSFPRRRELSVVCIGRRERHWVTACAGTTPCDKIRFAQVHATVTQLDGIGLRAALVGRDRLAAGKLDRPAVQRTNDPVAGHETLRQRPTAMRAAVDQREHLVRTRAEQRDRDRVAALHDPRTAPRDVVQRADLDPTAHQATVSGSYCRKSTPASRGRCHGSGSSASANCSWSHSARRPGASSTILRLT